MQQDIMLIHKKFSVAPLSLPNLPEFTLTSLFYILDCYIGKFLIVKYIDKMRSQKPHIAFGAIPYLCICLYFRLNLGIVQYGLKFFFS